MGKVFDKFMKTKWKDMGTLLGKPGPVAPQPTENPKRIGLKPGAVIPVPPADFSQLLQPTLQDYARQAQMTQEQQAANVFGGAFSSHNHTYSHNSYAQGVALATTSYGDVMLDANPSNEARKSMADPQVNAAVDKVIAKLKAKKGNHGS